MKSETITHELFVQVAFSDLYVWIKNYCKEKQLMPNVPKINKRMIQVGPHTGIGVNYNLNWKEDLSQELKVEKSITISFSPALVLVIIKDAVINQLSLASDEGYEWVMLKQHWCWENGAQGLSTVFNFNLARSRKELT